MTYNLPIGSMYHLYTTYILPSGGLYATYHRSWEPETTIEYMGRLLSTYKSWDDPPSDPIDFGTDIVKSRHATSFSETCR